MLLVLPALRKGHPQLWPWQKAVGRPAMTCCLCPGAMRAQTPLTGTWGSPQGWNLKSVEKTWKKTAQPGEETTPGRRPRDEANAPRPLGC